MKKSAAPKKAKMKVKVDVEEFKEKTHGGKVKKEQIFKNMTGLKGKK